MTTTRRRHVLKRIAVWTAAVVLLLVAYIAGAPIIGGLIALNFPAALPCVRAAYAPLGYYCMESDWPGSSYYRSYAEWCAEKVTILCGRPPNT